MIYQLRNRFIKATRWWKPGDHPRVGKSFISDMCGAFDDPEWDEVHPGDFIIEHKSGRITSLSKQLFDELYERIKEELCSE